LGHFHKKGPFCISFLTFWDESIRSEFYKHQKLLVLLKS
jgi:hypothetical protein